MSFDFLNIPTSKVDFNFKPFDGVPDLSEPVLDSQGNEIATFALVLDQLNQTTLPELQPAQPLPQRNLLYRDIHSGCLVPVLSHLVYTPCSPPGTLNMPERCQTCFWCGRNHLPSMECSQQPEQNEPADRKGPMMSAASRSKKRKIDSCDEFPADTIEIGSDDENWPVAVKFESENENWPVAIKIESDHENSFAGIAMDLDDDFVGPAYSINSTDGFLDLANSAQSIKEADSRREQANHQAKIKVEDDDTELPASPSKRQRMSDQGLEHLRHENMICPGWRVDHDSPEVLEMKEEQALARAQECSKKAIDAINEAKRYRRQIEASFEGR
ncbi:hypothetical protein ACLMJK_006289 [Lecanora helva]